LVKHLENPAANFEYLHITKYCVARATLLALNGDELDHRELHTALSKNQVQFGGIYRKHLILTFRNFFETHNIAKLPECDIHLIDPIQGSGQVAKNRDLLQCLIHTAEFDYKNTLTFLSLAPETNEIIYHHPASHWGLGGDMPKAPSVPVLVTTHATGYYIQPCKDEAKRMTCARRSMHKISVRNQEEFAFTKETESSERAGTPETERTEVTFPEGMPTAKVLGDFNVIVMPNGKKINLTAKHKGRAFLQFIHQRLSETGAAEFYDEEMRVAFNAQFSRDLAHRQWRSDRFRDDLFRGKEIEFDLLFETLDKGSGHYRLRVIFEMPNGDQTRIG